MNFDPIQIAIAAGAAALGFLARGRTAAPTPTPQPNQFPLLELILKLLAERFRVALPGQPLPQESLTQLGEPAWAQQLMAEMRSLKRSP